MMNTKCKWLPLFSLICCGACLTEDGFEYANENNCTNNPLIAEETMCDPMLATGTTVQLGDNFDEVLEVAGLGFSQSAMVWDTPAGEIFGVVLNEQLTPIVAPIVLGYGSDPSIAAYVPANGPSRIAVAFTNPYDQPVTINFEYSPGGTPNLTSTHFVSENESRGRQVAVEALYDGRFVYAWLRLSDQRLRYRICDFDKCDEPAGYVSSEGEGQQPRIAPIQGAGTAMENGFAIAFMDDRLTWPRDRVHNQGVFVRRFDAAGHPADSSDIHVYQYDEGDQVSPDVTVVQGLDSNELIVVGAHDWPDNNRRYMHEYHLGVFDANTGAFQSEFTSSYAGSTELRNVRVSAFDGRRRLAVSFAVTTLRGDFRVATETYLPNNDNWLEMIGDIVYSSILDDQAPAVALDAAQCTALVNAWDNTDGSISAVYYDGTSF